jgi:hypothetical protein
MRPKEKIQKIREKFKEKPHGWIQWKGTSVCMDVHCECGAHGHIDANFAYHLVCKNCYRIYYVDGHVKLIEIERIDPNETNPIEFYDKELGENNDSD